MVDKPLNSDFEMQVVYSGGQYSEKEVLTQNLMFSIVSSSKPDLQPVEKLYVINVLGFTDKINQRWLVDLYMKCGCFSEARKIFQEIGHWRKLGDLAWIEGDVKTAEKYYSKPEDRESQVFRGSKDWDRLLKLAYYQGKWEEMTKLFLEANKQSLSKDNFVLGSSAVSSKPYQKMLALALLKSNQTTNTALTKKITGIFSISLNDFDRTIVSVSSLSASEIEKSQKKTLPKILQMPPIDIENALKAGNTVKSNQLVSLIGDIEHLVNRTVESLRKYFKTRDASFLSDLPDVINGFFDESIAKTFLSFLISKIYDYIHDTGNSKEVTRLYETHPLLHRMYFGEILKLKFENDIPISSTDIYTGLLQSLFSVERDIADFMSKKPTHLLDQDKIISYADWVQLKIADWLSGNGKDVLQNIVTTWNTGSSLPVKTLFSPSKQKPNSPREMLEWHQFLDSCHEYITKYWETEIGIDRWKSEKSLYEIIKKSLKNYEVIRHAQPLWIEPQHFDIFIPDLSLAIEYMGEQHYHPVDFFGGKQGYEATVQRDERKINICKKVGVELIHVRYNDNLSIRVNEILSGSAIKRAVL